MRYRKLEQKDLDFLASVCGKERVVLPKQMNDDYTHDEMPEYGRYQPEVLVTPETTGEVSAILAYANENLLPVTPRGAGTGLCGGCVAIHGGILLSLERMKRIIEIDTRSLIAVVQPGVLLMELAEEVEKFGLLYPPDPGEKSATIGGNVMTNAGGMRAIKYGVTRDYVRGMEVVLPDGRIVRLGGRVAKSSSGYSLKDLLIGSEGTLGIVTELELKLIKCPKRNVTLMVPFDSLEACLAVVPKILITADAPMNLEFMEKNVILYAEKYLNRKFPDKSADAYLLVTYSGNTKHEIEDVYDEVARLCLEEGARDVFLSDTQERQDSIWLARGAFLEAIKNSTPGMDECDVVVPIGSVKDFLEYAKAVERQEHIRLASFGHAGDGNLHLYICKDELSEDLWNARRTKVMDLLYEEAIRLKGQVSGEHGIGHAKRKYLAMSVGETQIELMQGIKEVFDPKGILNPGKICMQ